MRTRKEKPKQTVYPVKPTTLNLQTRPFAPVETEHSDPVNAQNNSNSYKYNPANDLLLKLINSPIESRSTTNNDVVQRHTREHFAKIKSHKESASMPIQAKLNIGKPNDKYEQEADATATKVVKQINSSSHAESLQKQESLKSEDEELQMKTKISKIQRQESIEDEYIVQQNGGKVQRSPLKDFIQRDDTLPQSTVGGYGSDAIEGGGNFLEFLDDAANALKTGFDPNSSMVEKGISGSKAVGSFAGTVVAGLKANEIETMTSCLETMSEGMKIFDAGKEVWETVRKVDFWNDTKMQTFNNVWMVVVQLGDLIVSSTKIANAFVSSMEWATGRLRAFSEWLPLSELIVKCAKFINSVKQWIFAYKSYNKLKVLQSNISDQNKEKQIGYLVDEQWSRLKNGAVPIASSGLDFASESRKYLTSLNLDLAFTASLGTASKAVPLGHKVLTTGYDYVRQGWRNVIKNYASTNVAGYLAAIDKADLGSFRDGLADFVFNERNQPHGMDILESLGLGASVQTMGDTEAKNAIEDAIKDIK